MRTVFTAFVVIFCAELGDKSQLLALTCAARFRAFPVLAGVAAASAAVQGASVVVGAGLRASLPVSVVNVAAGAIFIAFSAWLLVEGDDEDGVRRVGAGPAVLAVATTFLLAEVGDKTMLATIALAARTEALGTWIGATLGLVVANGLAVVLGRRLSDLGPKRAVRLAAAALLAVFGFVLLVAGLSE